MTYQTLEAIIRCFIIFAGMWGIIIVLSVMSLFNFKYVWINWTLACIAKWSARFGITISLLIAVFALGWLWETRSYWR